MFPSLDILQSVWYPIIISNLKEIVASLVVEFLDVYVEKRDYIQQI